MEKSINERLTHLIEILNLSPNSFASQMGINTTIIYNIQKGRNKPGFDLLQKITDTFKVNGNWLLNGDGEPLLSYGKSDNQNYVKNDKVHAKSNDKVSLKTLAENAEIEGNYTNENRENFQKLKALKENYEKRLISELSLYNVELFNQLELKEKAHELSEMIWFMIGSYINNKPTPFETWKNRDFGSGKLNSPDSLDYEEYKKTIIEWLDDSKHFDEAIPSFLELSGKFLSTMREIIDKHKKEA